MNKLLIFGDSFAEETLIAYPKNHRLHDQVHSLTSYHKLLRDSNRFSQVISYGIGGSDLYSQYKLFLEQYTGTETVVWILTHPGRITIGNYGLCNINSVKELLHSWKNHEGYQTKSDYEQTINILLAAESYFTHLVRSDYDNFVQSAIIDKITQVCPTVKFIPAFYNSFGSVTSQEYLGQIYTKENVEFGITSEDERFEIYKNYYDIRRNHMTEKNHIILADQIIRLISLDKPILYRRFVYPDSKLFDKYFIKRETL